MIYSHEFANEGNGISSRSSFSSRNIWYQWPLKFFKRYILSAKQMAVELELEILHIFFWQIYRLPKLVSKKLTLHLPKTQNFIFAGYATIPSSMIIRLITSRIFQLPSKDFPIFWELASILQLTTYGLMFSRIRNFLFVKFSFSKKVAKICAIFLMVLTFTN